MKKLTLMLCATTTLAACGGGGGGGSSSYDDAFDKAIGLALSGDYASLDYTDAADIPTSDTATYNGYFGAGNVDINLIGDLSVGVDFGDDTFDGRVDNLIDSDNRRYSGGVDMAGTIDRSPAPVTFYQLNGTASGTISNADAGNYDVTGTVRGDFLGDSVEGLDIEIFGEADDGVGTVPFDGAGFALR